MTATHYDGHKAVFPCWNFRLATKFLNYNGQSHEQKARETASEVILNYGVHIVTTMELLSRSLLPSDDTMKWYSAAFVSHETLYK
jgi:hypothetical protein